jgi:hypothetical protein
MVRRLLAAALALTVIGSPVAAGVCQATCVAREMMAAHATGVTEHHACHGQAFAVGPTVNGAAHICGHPDDFPMGTDQSLQIFPSPAVVVATISFIPPDAGSPNFGSTEAEHSPPGLVALRTHLRI